MESHVGIDSLLAATHVLLFPFMSKGHTIPVLHLARLLLRRGAAVTVITTPANHPFVTDFLSGTQASIAVLPFPQNIDGIPPGVESTDKLPSISLFFPFAAATKQMQTHFETFLSSISLHNAVSFLVSDGFLHWTLESSSKFGIPRLFFYGMSNYAITVSREVAVNRHQIEAKTGDELFSVPNLPSVKLTLNDFEAKIGALQSEFLADSISSASRSFGLIVNSFYELEPHYFNHWNHNAIPKAWCLGPFCLEVEQPPKENNDAKSPPPRWMKWLDEKLEKGKSVLYVAFGSQAEISREQLEEIQIGLEKSEVNFLWVVRGGGHGEKNEEFEFENRVKNRGMVVREWVDQRAILEHGSVTGFLSHCGWNSVIESICAKVPILAWPMMAEQHLNARFVTEEIGIGIRVETCDGSVRGFVKWEALQKMVRELMEEGDKGMEARKKMEELAGAARRAVANGGSSWRSLNDLILEMHARKQN